MKQSFSNNVKTFCGRLAVAGTLALSMGATSAMACSLANWSSVSGGFIANQPDGAAGDPVNATLIPRYAELCGSQAPAGAASFVADFRPAGITMIIARFYVFNDGATDPQVYGGFSDNSGGGQLFDVSYSGTNIVFTAGGASVQDAAQTGWNSVEVSWESGGDISLILNGGATQTSAGASTGSLSSVHLGNLNGAAGGPINFDGYESHRTTPVGRLCNCNANGSGDNVVNVLDVIATVNEAGGGALATGTPDCNEDGSINVLDVVSAVNIAGGAGVCTI